MTAYRSSKPHATRRGQAIIEMAIVVTLLMFFTMILIQFALIANARITLLNITREGTRYAAVHALDATVAGITADTLIKNRIVAIADTTLLNSITASDITITYLGMNGRQSSQPVRVAVNYNMQQKFILPVNK